MDLEGGKVLWIQYCAQVNKECVVAVFFDLEKAYDMLWREGLLIKIHKLGIRGRMYRWILDFLKGRYK